MRRASLLLALVATASTASARPAHRPVHPRAPAARPAPPLPFLQSISRVRVEVARDHVVVVEDVTLPRGEWTQGDLDLYVAFGAPGAPRAFDARLLPLAAGQTQAPLDDAGDAVTTERAPHRPVSAQVLVGRANMAGAILHVKEAAFRKALEPADAAVVRLRTLLDRAGDDGPGAHDLVVRLGVAGGPPLALARVEIAAADARSAITRAEAQLCGPDADPYPLSIAITPRPAASTPADRAPLAPVLAVRHATDDLCIRYATAR